MNSNPNLFTSLHRWASHQDENFTTESFVFLLKYLQDWEPISFLAIISNITGGLIDQKSCQTKQIEVLTQCPNENTIQDIQIKTKDKLAFIEVKLGSALTRKQILGYLDLLNRSQYKPENTRLICLTRSPVPNDVTEGTLPLRWYQVAELLEKECTSITRETTLFLIREFLDFLGFQNATLTKVSSTISQGIINYQKNNTGTKSILNRRFRSLDKLFQVNDLRPLHDLMMLVFECLKEIVGEKMLKLDSSNNKSGRGNVAYNINQGEYFVWVEYRQPEILIITTYNRLIEENLENLRFGKIVIEYKRLQWKNTVDLVAQGFFMLDKQEQLSLLRKIIISNLEFAESISQPLRKGS